MIINFYSNVKKIVNCDDYLIWVFWKNLICFFVKFGKESYIVEFIGLIYGKLFKKFCNCIVLDDDYMIILDVGYMVCI